MAEGVVAQVEAAPGYVFKAPWTSIIIGFMFLVLVLVVEAFKPGLLTGPIRKGLVAIGVKNA